MPLRHSSAKLCDAQRRKLMIFEERHDSAGAPARNRVKVWRKIAVPAAGHGDRLFLPWAESNANRPKTLTGTHCRNLQRMTETGAEGHATSDQLRARW